MQETGAKRKFVNQWTLELEDPDQLQIYEFKSQDFQMVVK